MTIFFFFLLLLLIVVVSAASVVVVGSGVVVATVGEDVLAVVVVGGESLDSLNKFYGLSCVQMNYPCLNSLCTPFSQMPENSAPSG